MTTHRRLAYVDLDTSISDPVDRTIMPMQRLIGVDGDPPNHMWLIETSWDGASIGDVQVFRNQNCSHAGNPATDKDGEPLPANWVWWGGVPRGRIKSYRFAAGDVTLPMTLGDDVIPFELPKTDAERKEKPGSLGKGGPARA